MKKYKYINTETYGYERFRIGWRDQNRIFKYRRSSIARKYEYYYNGKDMIMHYTPSILACVTMTVFSPLFIIIHGIGVTYEAVITDGWLAKRNGAFCKDEITQPEYIEQLLKARKKWYEVWK